MTRIRSSLAAVGVGAAAAFATAVAGNGAPTPAVTPIATSAPELGARVAPVAATTPEQPAVRTGRHHAATRQTTTRQTTHRTTTDRATTHARPGCGQRAVTAGVFDASCSEYQGYLDPGRAAGRAPTSGERQAASVANGR